MFDTLTYMYAFALPGKNVEGKIDFVVKSY